MAVEGRGSLYRGEEGYRKKMWLWGELDTTRNGQIRDVRA
jgi:hypothetical protein